MKEEWLEIVLKDGSSARIKNVSTERFLLLRQLLEEEEGKKIILEANQNGKFFEISISEIESWGDSK